MRKQNNDEQFLLALSRRPGMEPDPLFIEGLREKMFKSNEKRKRFSIHFGAVAAMVTVVSILAVSGLSYLTSTEKPQHQASTSKNEAVVEIKDSDAVTIEHNLNVSELLQDNEHYAKIYESLLAGMNDSRASEVIIFYLDSLKNGNVDAVKRYAFSPEKEEQIKGLIAFYQSIDYATLTIKEMIPSKGEPSFEIIFQFKVEDSNQTRSIHINLTDEYNISIYEPEAGNTY